MFAWLAARDARVPQGEFPPLTDCGQVDPLYLSDKIQDEYLSGYYDSYQIPMSLNEPWRGGLAIWLMSLGPTFCAISVFLILRDEFTSRRWGTLRSAGLADSAHWSSWFMAFGILAVINSLAGAITAIALPNIHAFESVNFGSIFGPLLFLNLALTASSFFLVAMCGSINSTTITVFIIMAIIVASSAPAIGTSVMKSWSLDSSSSTSTSQPEGTAGSFFAYGSTERVRIDYPNSTWNDDFSYEYVPGEASVSTCQVPIISDEQGRFRKTEAERDFVTKEEIFLGCYVIPGASSAFVHSTSSLYLVWYMIPHTSFMMAWSNILGYTSLPGNAFSLSHASKSPEVLAQEALFNHKGGVSPLYEPNKTEGTSLFPQGSTVAVTYEYNYYYDYSDPKSNCPSSNVIENLCDDYDTATCYSVHPGYPSSSPSLNDCIGLLVSLIAIYVLLAAYVSAVLPMGNGNALKLYFFLQPSFWCGFCSSGGNSDKGAKSDVEEGNTTKGRGVEALGVGKSYGKVRALKPLSLSMNVGEVTALLG